MGGVIFIFISNKKKMALGSKLGKLSCESNINYEVGLQTVSLFPSSFVF